MKPRYRLRAGRWCRVSNAAKPVLKLHLDGRLSLITPSPAAVASAADVKSSVIAHYGSIKAFARHWGVSHNAVYLALNSWSERMAGQVRHVCLIFGLPSAPTPQACSQAFHKAVVRGAA